MSPVPHEGSGAAGATVYVTGRSTGGDTTESLPGTVEGVAAEVTARGGTGIAVRCDFRDDAQVEALFARVAAGHGKLDILVNNVWAGYEGQPNGLSFAPFWKLSLDHWDRMSRAACARTWRPPGWRSR